LFNARRLLGGLQRAALDVAGLSHHCRGELHKTPRLRVFLLYIYEVVTLRLLLCFQPVFSFFYISQKKLKPLNFYLGRFFCHASFLGTQVMVLLAWGSEWLKMNSDVFKRFMFKLLGAVSRDGDILASESGPVPFFLLPYNFQAIRVCFCSFF
jgi:hypothetical protein